MHQSDSQSDSQSNSLLPIVGAKATTKDECVVLIDKLDINCGLLKKSDIIQNIHEQGLHDLLVESEFTSDIGFLGFVYKALPNSKYYFYKITSNPNKFSSYDEYLQVLDRVIPDKIKDRIQIQRLDIAVDFINKPFKDADKTLKIRNKQIVERIVIKGSHEKTRYFGERSSSRYKMYDKKKEVKRKGARSIYEHSLLKLENCTRVELTLMKNKLPTRDIFKLKEELLYKNHKLFKGVSFEDFMYVPQKKEMNSLKKKSNEIMKFTQLMTLIDHCGYQYTKKVLNHQRAYFRDYDYFLSSQGSFRVQDIIHEGLKTYFENKNLDIVLRYGVDNERQ